MSVDTGLQARIFLETLDPRIAESEASPGLCSSASRAVWVRFIVAVISTGNVQVSGAADNPGKEDGSV